MRAEIARHYGGTPFDEVYLTMRPERLYVLLTEARRARRVEAEREARQVKYFDTLARFISMISNPEAYDKFLKHEKLETYKHELTPEQAKKDFETLKQMGLEFLEVDMPEPVEEADVPLDPEIEKYFERTDGRDVFRPVPDGEASPIHTSDLVREIEKEGDV